MAEYIIQPMEIRSPFLFTTCQVGAEKALKEEIARDYPELKFSFSRPGFLTFKSPSELPPDYELRAVFARAYGLSLGKVKTLPELLEKARGLGIGKPRLHLFERDLHPHSEEPMGYEKGARARILRAEIEALPGFAEVFEKDPFAAAGDWVFDAVVVEENEFWWGVHQHSPLHSRAPGADPGFVLPEDAPSRAYLKLEEALDWSGAPLKAGDHAVEIGSAPGGASLALLRRGVNVVGIDPGEMDPRVLRFRGGARFEHIMRPVATVPREELPESVEWLLLDMNVEPRISLFSVDRLATRMSDTLLGMILTVKLNQWDFAKQVPHWLEHVRLMGMSKVRATQLAHSGREIVIYGITRKGLSRAVKGS